MERRLYRSRSNRVIWGVCGGLAEYCNIDPVIIRIILVLLIFANGLGILAYIIMTIIVPLEGSRASTPQDTIRENVEEMKETATDLGEDIKSTFATPEGRPKAVDEKRNRGLYILGIAIVVIGILFLLVSLNLFWWFRWNYLWPFILVAMGIIIIITARRR